MNVLIVDDEPIIRIGLKSLVDWEENGFRLVGEAADGEEALALIRRDPVDIVITDIRMPKMDGLALMREVKSLKDDVGMLVLSCLDDFAFVKEAMKLGAYDYILKPTMEPDELLAIMQTVRTKLEEERKTKRVLAEWREQVQQSSAFRLAEWLRHYVRTGAGQERLESELFPGGCGAFSIWIEGDPDALPALDEWSVPHARATVKWSDRVWIVLCGFDRGSSEKDRHDLMFGCAQSLFVRLKETMEADRDWCVCVGPAMLKLRDFAHALTVHRRQQHGRFYGDPERLVVGEPAALADDGALPSGERNDFLRAVSNGNGEAASYWIERLTESLRRHKPDVAKLRTFLGEMFGLAFEFAGQQDNALVDGENRQRDVADAIAAIPHIEPLCSFVRETARRIWSKPLDDGIAREPSNPFIKKAMRFMREQYSRNIGTVDIADHVKLSRSYLSDLFSREMGESLTETLTRIRIGEAKRKLRSGEMKVYEVAEAVGFADPKSFAKTFKRLVGCTPKEFEQRAGEGVGNG